MVRCRAILGSTLLLRLPFLLPPSEVLTLLWYRHRRCRRCSGTQAHEQICVRACMHAGLMNACAARGLHIHVLTRASIVCTCVRARVTRRRSGRPRHAWDPHRELTDIQKLR